MTDSVINVGELWTEHPDNEVFERATLTFMMGDWRQRWEYAKKHKHWTVMDDLDREYERLVGYGAPEPKRSKIMRPPADPIDNGGGV